MKLLHLSKELLDALTAVCHSALQAKGLEHVDAVAAIKKAIQDAPEAPAQDKPPVEQ